jgi:hypothetical protein
MRSIHPKTSRPGSGFNGTGGCNPSVLARGTPTRIYHGIMHEYSSSRISSGLNVRFADARKKRVGQYRSVYHVQGRPTCIPDTSLRVRLGQELLCISKTSRQRQLSGAPDALLSRSVFCNMNTKNRSFTLPFRGIRNMKIPCAPRLVTVLPLSVSAVVDST